MTGKDLTKLSNGIYELLNDKGDTLKLEVKTLKVEDFRYGPIYIIQDIIEGNIKIWDESLSIKAEIQIKPLGFFTSDITSKMLDFKLKDKFTIKDLAEGKCAIHYNPGICNRDDLEKVLKLAFPKSDQRIYGSPYMLNDERIFLKMSTHTDYWWSERVSETREILPTQLSKDFL